MVYWIVFSFLWYQLIAHVGISLGLHRYFAHKQFKLPVLMEYLILFLATMAGARSPIGWIAAHRMHHADSDGPNDPHSPLHKGFFTVVTSMWSIRTIPPRFAKDLFASRSLSFFHHNWKWVWLGSAISMLLISTNAFLFLVLIPALTAWMSFGLLNACCHRGGVVRNIPVLNLLTGGEGYHLEHHNNGRQMRFHRLDLTGLLLDFLKRRGFISR